MDVPQASGEMLPDPNNDFLLVFSIATGVMFFFVFGLILAQSCRLINLSLALENQNAYYMTLPIYNPSTETVSEKTVRTRALILATLQLLQKLTNSTAVRVSLPDFEDYADAREFLHEITGTEMHSAQAYTQKPLVDLK